MSMHRKRQTIVQTNSIWMKQSFKYAVYTTVLTCISLLYKRQTIIQMSMYKKNIINNN